MYQVVILVLGDQLQLDINMVLAFVELSLQSERLSNKMQVMQA